MLVVLKAFGAYIKEGLQNSTEMNSKNSSKKV
jgi:hypothetical protein